MFDADTIALIADAPPLEGLDLEDLPQRLTSAYASIITTRVRLREITKEQALPDDVAAILGEMLRLAFTYEAFVSALPEREDRAAAALVAGAAHHVRLLAKRAGGCSGNAQSPGNGCHIPGGLGDAVIPSRRGERRCGRDGRRLWSKRMNRSRTHYSWLWFVWRTAGCGVS
jgi:hypothetical protein